MQLSSKVFFNVDEFFKSKVEFAEDGDKSFTDQLFLFGRSQHFQADLLNEYWNVHNKNIDKIQSINIDYLRNRIESIKNEVKKQLARNQRLKRIKKPTTYVNLKDEFNLEIPILIKRSKLNEFFSKKVKKYKAVKVQLKSQKKVIQKIIQKRNIDSISLVDKTTAKTLTTMVRFNNICQNLESEFITDLKKMESIHDYFKNNEIKTKVFDEIHSDILAAKRINLTKTNMRRIMDVLDIKYKKIKKRYKENPMIKNWRIVFLNELINLYINKKNDVYFFDCTSFNYNSKAIYSWQMKSCQMSYKPINDFKAVHLLMVISFKKLVSFQLIKGSLNSKIVVKFLNESVKQIRGHQQGKQIHMILDNATIHKTELMKSFALKLKIHFHFIVPRNPFFNIIEFVFRYMKSRKGNRLPEKKFNK